MTINFRECPTCGGYGIRDSGKTCSTCKGSGELMSDSDGNRITHKQLVKMANADQAKPADPAQGREEGK
jgi:DnaJ-class molecular chaperone